MELLKIHMQNQQLLDTLYPRSIRKIMEMQKAAVQSAKLMSWAEGYKPIIHHPSLTTYFKTFAAIEGINKSAMAFDTAWKSHAFSEITFDFDDLLKEEEEEKQVIVQEVDNLKRIIATIYKDNSQLLRLEPRKFEEIIAELLFAQGFEVELTKQTRDGGYDIIAIQKLQNHFPLKFLVECKHHKNRIGIEIIRSFKNVIDEQNANRGILVTTSYFSREAIKAQKQYPYLLDFRDKDAVLEWVSKYIDKILAS
jgi:restriction endonuclease Mrr